MALMDDVLNLKNKVDSVKTQLENTINNSGDLDVELLKAYKTLNVSLIPPLQYLEDTIQTYKEVEEKKKEKKNLMDREKFIDQKNTKL